jgi:hypothetical protein
MAGHVRTRKRVTYRRADRVIYAAVDLMECTDFNKFDPDGKFRDRLNAACDAARKIREITGEPR